MTSRVLCAALAALALPFTAFAQAPEYQQPESVVHAITAPPADPFGLAASDLPVSEHEKKLCLALGKRLAETALQLAK